MTGPDVPDGTALRRAVPRSAHAQWETPKQRDPVGLLIAQGASRIPELLPMRYARMATDPFAFLRGAAAVMAADLATTPATGLRVQSCGDAHLANFGAFASPEGTPLFDVNDFDETLPAPFEWDVKRLATSLAVAGHVEGLNESACHAVARRAVEAYGQHLAGLAKLAPDATWSSSIGLEAALAECEPAKLRRRAEKQLRAALARGASGYGLVGRDAAGRPCLRMTSPAMRPLGHHGGPVRAAYRSYTGTLEENRLVLLRQYELVDAAFKVVGVGSVGTYCAVALLAAEGAPLLLQIKEAQESVLGPYAGPSAYALPGERVVVGQRMLQAAPDVFLGWTRQAVAGRHFYVRRLKDAHLAAIGERLEGALPFYAGLCGRTLARAHARAGAARPIAAYVGRGGAFAEAVARFAVSYAAQTVRDWHDFLAAAKAGRITLGQP